ncbi:MAG: vWA domain-containing protein, partial [Burkholderiales bacterium]
MSIADTAYAKVSAARARLILERPFIGALVMHLPLEAASAHWCDTIATDARMFYFNANYVEKLDFAEVQFVLSHAALHCALGHFARRAHRTLRRWNVACDHAVNLLLLDDGLKAPRGALAKPEYRGLSAEEIYPLLRDDEEERPLDQHIAEGFGRSGAERGATASQRRPVHEQSSVDGATCGEGHEGWDDAGNEGREGVALAPHVPQPHEREALATAWQSRMSVAAQRARETGRLAASWARLVDQVIQPALPWRVLLARYMMNAAREDYSYARLSKRDGQALMPRVSSADVDVCIALDTSGSIDAAELEEFAAEVDALKSQIRARITLLACDERLDDRAPWTFQAWEAVSLPGALTGGAGTSFVPVFEWAARAHYRPDVLVYFTD